MPGPRPHSPFRRVASLLVVVALVAGTSCSSGGDQKDTARPADTDPMYAVSDAARFTSDGKAREGWHWLDEADQTARWEFRGLPEDLTDLVTQLRVAVPDDAEAGDFYFSFGVDDDDEALGAARAALPLDAQVEGQTRLASSNVTIPEASLPDDFDSLWVEVGRRDPTGEHPDLGAAVAFRKESLRFAPLRIEPSDEEPVPGDTSTSAAEHDGASAAPTTATTGPAGAPPPPTTPSTVPGTVEFTVDGDLIQGWYFDQEGQVGGDGTELLHQAGRSQQPEEKHGDADL